MKTINSTLNRFVADAAPKINHYDPTVNFLILSTILFSIVSEKKDSSCEDRCYIPRAIPSAAACTTRPKVAVQVALDLDKDALVASSSNNKQTNNEIFFLAISLSPYLDFHDDE